MKKTKIVCTIGPSTDDENIMRELMKNGMDVARFNFSHSDHSVHKARFETVCKLREELGVNIATLLDTKGPEVRLKNFKDHKPVTIKDGDTFTLTTREVEGDETICSITFPQLPKDVSVGTRILINDGNIELKALRVDNTDIVCEVIHGGVVSDHKGINVPDVNLSMPYISDADMSDLEFGAKMGFDYIAASFVRTGADVIYLRKFTQSLGWFNPRIIAKIENAQGVANIDEILDAADGIMVARGDMGVEIPFEQIPAIQKELIRKAYNAGKNVITATQMLDSMIRNPRPTRAEVSDVANAVYDGTDVVMLSGETANGKYPIEALKMMAHIVEETESHMNGDFYEKRTVSDDNRHNISNAVSYASVATAESLDAAVIIAPSISGYTARMLSKWHPSTKLVGMSPSISAVRKMMLYWGVTPFQAKRAESTDTLIENSIDILKENGIVKTGDIAVVTAGVVDYAKRHEPAASTNIMRVVNID